MSMGTIACSKTGKEWARRNVTSSPVHMGDNITESQDTFHQDCVEADTLTVGWIGILGIYKTSVSNSHHGLQLYPCTVDAYLI